MSNKQYTPEPWRIEESDYAGPDPIFCIDNPNEDGYAAECQNLANALRIVSCVNALTNIPDPEQWVSEMKAENTMLKVEVDKLREQRSKDGLAGQAQLDEDGNLIATLKAENERLKDLVAEKNKQIEDGERIAQRLKKKIRRHILGIKS